MEQLRRRDFLDSTLFICQCALAGIWPIPNLLLINEGDGGGRGFISETPGWNIVRQVHTSANEVDDVTQILHIEG
jgi:hypothetical protein